MACSDNIIKLGVGLPSVPRILGPSRLSYAGQWRKNHRQRNSMTKESRGSFEGAIRIPLHASLFLFNDLPFLRIPRKSLKFPTLLFSIPTAPTKPTLFSVTGSRLF